MLKIKDFTAVYIPCLSHQLFICYTTLYVIQSAAPSLLPIPRKPLLVVRFHRLTICPIQLRFIFFITTEVFNNLFVRPALKFTILRTQFYLYPSCSLPMSQTHKVKDFMQTLHKFLPQVQVYSAIQNSCKRQKILLFVHYVIILW